jgi:hypothetical protein
VTLRVPPSRRFGAPNDHCGDGEQESPGYDERGAEAETRRQKRADERPDEASHRGDSGGQAEDGSAPLYWGEVGDEGIG